VHWQTGNKKIKIKKNKKFCKRETFWTAECIPSRVYRLVSCLWSNWRKNIKEFEARL